jgi:Sap, sulfolipid-1-addressing protein
MVAQGPGIPRLEAQMGNAIGQVLPLAVGVALSPVPIIAVALMLMSQRARLNGPVFVIGWLVGLAVIGVVVLAVAGPADASSNGEPATWISVLKLVLGLLLVLLAARQWRGRPRLGQEVEAPKWMGSVERFSPGKASGAGVVLSGANPKNTLLAIGAAVAIAQTGTGAQTRPSRMPSSPSSRPWAWRPRSLCSSLSATGPAGSWPACGIGWPSTTRSSWPSCA